MNELKPCPFCGGSAKIIVLDDEFNIQDEEYENDPYSGLQFGLSHQEEENSNCPIANDNHEVLGNYGYETREEAVDTWNSRFGNEVIK